MHPPPQGREGILRAAPRCRAAVMPATVYPAGHPGASHDKGRPVPHEALEPQRTEPHPQTSAGDEKPVGSPGHGPWSAPEAPDNAECMLPAFAFPAPDRA